ncbi:unnamed protein product [Trichogramma brassicae]|uniref:Uncharacterized protein n=1 Tax=Trichogramma brassicae TaxID=86971 RepID=A0A6H5I826_9HYME|nr:unnamed protein product [Trichogramma brassicae]
MKNDGRNRKCIKLDKILNQLIDRSIFFTAANSSTASAPRRTDHRRPTASSPGREPARFQSSSSSICRRFQDIPLGNHGSRARSRSRGPRSHERDDHRRVHQRSRSASRHLRADTSESRRTHRSRSLSRSRTRQHYRSGARRRSSKSPGQPRHRSIRSRSRSPPKRVHQRSRSNSEPRHRRVDAAESSRRTLRSWSLSRSRTSQHYRSGARRRSSKSPGQPRHRSIRSRSRSPPRRSSREEMIRRGANVFGPQIPYGFIMLPPGMFPMGPFPGGVVKPLPRFPFPPPPPPPPPSDPPSTLSRVIPRLASTPEIPIIERRPSIRLIIHEAIVAVRFSFE